MDLHLAIDHAREIGVQSLLEIGLLVVAGQTRHFDLQ
jgi:hypothetical protein